MDILKSISQILKTKTIAHSAITLSGTAVNGVLGVLFFIILARILGPENFGAISISIIVLTMVADISDFGINTGLINFVGKHNTDNFGESLRFLKLGLILKLIIFLIVLSVGYSIAPFVANFVFLKPELAFYLRLSFVGVGGAMLFSFSTNSLQALQKYKSWAYLNVLSNGLRLFLTVVLSGSLLLNATNALLVYIAFPFFGFLASLFFLPKNFLFISNERRVFREFFHYNKWVALSILIAAVSSRLDSFFTARFLPIDQTGFYSVGVQLSSILPQFTYAIASVAAPKIASYSDKKQLYVYLRKLQLYTLVLALAGFVLSPIAFIAIPLIYTSAYSVSIWPFLILLYAQLIFLLSIPSHQTIFYYFSNPKIFVIISLIVMGVLISLNLLLIPMFGIVGAAVTVLAGSVINFILPSVYVYSKFKKR